ncbi:MAG: hypothetical protein ACKO9U_07425 [Dolichospermum sp.]
MTTINWNKIPIPRKQTATFKWSSEHAAIVHEGVTLRNGTELPARPWVDETVQQFNTTEAYAQNFQESEDFAQAFTEMAEGFGAKAQEIIETQMWQWPRETVRRNGTVVGSPRDIIDTGELRDSYTMEIRE